MKLPAIPLLYRRAILIYFGTIVVSAVLLVYLGVPGIAGCADSLRVAPAFVAN